MKFSFRSLPCFLLAFFVVDVGAATNDPLEQIANVGDITTFNNDPCTAETDKLKHHEDLPIEVGDKFKVDKRDMLKRYINVESEPNNIMGKPNLYVINAGGPVLKKNYCLQGGDVKSHLYVFGIGELENPTTHERSLHAFVYVPMKLHPTSASLADEFYLMVFSIPIDTIQCGGIGKKRCKALRRLVVSQAINPEADYIKDVRKEMKNILPRRPPQVMRYHNGVIHGSL